MNAADRNKLAQAAAHKPMTSDDGRTIRCSCGSWITHTRDGREAALLRFAGHLRHVATMTGAAR